MHITRLLSGVSRLFARVAPALAVLAVCLACLSLPAQGDVLPPVSTVVTCSNGVLIEDPSSCVNGGASASLTLLPFVSESVQASAAPGPLNGAGALANITYSFEVFGGTPGELVPLIIATNLSAAATSVSHADGFASITVETSQGLSQVCVDTGVKCGGVTQFSGTLTAGTLSGEVDTLVIEAEANAGDSPSFESASASADPFIFVDPSFDGANQLSIVVSPGVGNALPTPAVPEPGSIALLGGLVLVLAGYRRRQSRVVPRLARH